MSLDDYDFSEAISYHTGEFPPRELDYSSIAPKLAEASASLAKYDALLGTLPNSLVLLAPLRRREAVISSRIEGTVATLDEVLKFEADETEEDSNNSTARRDVLEVFSYTRAMNKAQSLMNEGLPVSGRLLKGAHSQLLMFGRGADKQPGEFKTDQNYVVDQVKKKIRFIPVSPEKFDGAILEFEKYVNADHNIPLVQTAIAHAELEAIHPFKDGNGRLGRMLITLMLWDKKLISEPHFYISECIEKRKDEYIDRLRLISKSNEWTEWVAFFLSLVVDQAAENTRVAHEIRNLYEEMKEVFRENTSSQYSINALDFVFSRPVFRNSAFLSQGGMPRPTASRISKALVDSGLLVVIEPASGRRAALLGFEPLLSITRV